jgi:hypothetical protein
MADVPTLKENTMSLNRSSGVIGADTGPVQRWVPTAPPTDIVRSETPFTRTAAIADRLRSATISLENALDALIGEGHTGSGLDHDARPDAILPALDYDVDRMIDSINRIEAATARLRSAF